MAGEKRLSKSISYLKGRKFAGLVSYYDLLIFSIIILSCMSLRFYNASDLSGGDDSQFAELSAYAISDPSRILYPAFPDEPIARRDWHFSRPILMIVYVSSVLMLGYTRYAMIFPAAIFSALSAILIYLIVRRQFDEKTALLSTALFAFSPFFLAFSRIGLLHAQLTFLGLLAFYLLYIYLETDNVVFIYLSSICWLFNAWTTDFRGLVTALAIIPFFYIRFFQSNNTKAENFRTRFMLMIRSRMFLHFIISLICVIVVYAIYITIPFLLKGDASYIYWLWETFLHALGMRESTEYLSFLAATVEMGKYIFLTPFAGFIIIPALFGIIASIIKIRESRHMFWLLYLLPISVFYLQGQFSPERQIIFMPALCTLSAIGLLTAARAYLRDSKSILMPLLIFCTAAFYLIILASFPSIFPSEYASASQMLEASIILKIMNILQNYHYLFIFAAGSAAAMLVFAGKRLSVGVRRTTAITFIFVVILANMIFSVIAVTHGLGIYKRTTEVTIIGNFLKQNLGDEKYSCVADIHASSLTYYSQKPCAFWLAIDTGWLDENSRKGDVRYYIVNLNYREGITIGLGQFNRDGTFNKDNTNDHKWLKNYDDKYEWLTKNTVDITDAVSPDKMLVNFRVYAYTER